MVRQIANLMEVINEIKSVKVKDEFIRIIGKDLKKEREKRRFRAKHSRINYAKIS